jgi:hypothetical protein
MYEASLPTKQKNVGKIKNGWIKQGIRIFCKQKSCLYMHSRNSCDPHTKAFYVKYYKILYKIIIEANT